MCHRPEHIYSLFYSDCTVDTGLAKLVEKRYFPMRAGVCFPRWWLVAITVLLSLLQVNPCLAAVKDSGMASDSGIAGETLKDNDEQGALTLLPYHTLFVIDEFLRLPSDVAVDPEGKIYILDGTDSVVRVYSKHGKPLYTLGNQKTLNLPMGLDVSPDGGVLIADSGNHRIVYFPAVEEEPVFFDIPAPAEGKPSDPTDVVFNHRYERFFVVDNDNHRVLSLDMKGRVLWSSGRMGRNPEEFRYPFMLDRDNDDNLFIGEVINTRVQVLDPQGEHIRFIGDWGIEAGQFFRPKGIAMDTHGRLFVSDSYLGVIQVFTSDGDFLGAIGDEEGSLRKFTTPMGMAVSGKRLFVIEMYSNRLVVLEQGGP